MLTPRAPRACHACRGRKIKCDVAKRGIPCGNCSRTKVECLVSHARKTRTRITQLPKRASLPSTALHIFEANSSNSPRHGGLLEEFNRGQPPPEATGRLATEELDYLQSPVQNFISPTISSCLYAEHGSDPYLPGFIAPLRQGLDSEVLLFLRRKNALSIPQQSTREELLRTYIWWILKNSYKRLKEDHRRLALFYTKRSCSPLHLSSTLSI